MAKLPHQPLTLKNPDRGDPRWYFYQLLVNGNSTKIVIQIVKYPARNGLLQCRTCHTGSTKLVQAGL